MILTREMAEENVGRYIDCYKRIGGYYPKQIIRLKDGSGALAVKDTTGTCVKVIRGGQPHEYYDYIFEMIKEDADEI